MYDKGDSMDCRGYLRLLHKKGQGNAMLEKLKDIFYDKNDIIVALAILAVAGFIITQQVDSIMTYPEQLAAEVQQEQESIPPEGEGDISGAKPEGEGGSTPPVNDGQGEGEAQEGQSGVVPDQPTQPDTPSQTTQTNSGEFKTAVARTVEIPSGSHSSSIASILANAGVVPSKDAFLSAVSAAGAETKLKAGTFTIPAGSTLSDVVAILTK